MDEKNTNNPALVIQNLISDYKSIPWWRKILYFLPFIFLLIAVFIYLLINKRDTLFNLFLKQHKNQVDSQLDDLSKKKDEIIQQEQKLDQEIEKEKQEIEKHENEAKTIVERIDDANSFDDLRKIHQELGRD